MRLIETGRLPDGAWLCGGTPGVWAAITDASPNAAHMELKSISSRTARRARRPVERHYRTLIQLMLPTAPPLPFASNATFR
jgi:hypothetical protein